MRQLSGIEAFPENGARRRPIILTMAAAVLAVVFVVIGLGHGASTPAEALTPPPLQFERSDMEASEMIRQAMTSLDRMAGPRQPERHAQYTGWYAQIDGDARPQSPVVIVPETTDLAWQQDLSAVQTVVTSEPYWADLNRSEPFDDTVPSPGTEISRTTFAPGEFAVPFTEPFGDSTEDLRQALSLVGLPETYTAADLIDSIDTLMTLWTLTPTQHKAILSLLGDTDARLLGVTTDRLGRTVIGFGADSTAFPGTQRTLLIEEASGLIVGTETTRTTPEAPLPAGAVLSYTLWKGAQ